MLCNGGEVEEMVQPCFVMNVRWKTLCRKRGVTTT